MKRFVPVLSTISLAIFTLSLIWGILAVNTAAASPVVQEDTTYPDPEEALDAAVNWLVETHQNSDGGYTSFSIGADQAPSDIGGTIDALLALGAAGADASGPLSYLSDNAQALTGYASADGSTAGKALLALARAGEDPTDFAGNDFVLALSDHYSPTGQFNVNNAFNQSLAILGLAAAGEDIPDGAPDWLESLQATEGDLAGSWDDGFGTAGNTDSTALAILALLASGRGNDDSAVSLGLDFLASSQLESGGWEYGPAFGENANSTALVLQALVASGQDIYTEDSRWIQSNVPPQLALLGWQSQSGAFQADFGDGPFDDFFSTVQAIPAIGFLTSAAIEETMDVPAVGDPLDAAVTWLVETHQNSDGGYTSFSIGADQAPSDIGGTIDALWALGVAEADVSESLEYLNENADALAEYAATDGSTAGKTVLALTVAGSDPNDFSGYDFVLSLTEHLLPTGQFNVNTAFNQSLAILGLAIAGEDIPNEAIDWLLELQETEGDFTGSWDDGFGTAGNADSTAMAIMAISLGARGSHSDAVEAGLDFLANAQLESGGWEYGPGFGENANSTALVIQALFAARQDTDSEESRWIRNGITPQAALLGWQGDSGAFQADFGDGRFDDFFSTVQAIPALELLLGPEPVLMLTPTATPEPVATSESTAEPTATIPSPTAEPTETPAPIEPTEQPGEDASIASAEVDAQEDQGGNSTTIIIILVVVAGVAGLGIWYVLNRRG